MGSDNIFHRRKAKKANDLARKRASRESYDKVLIVCEGRKTEPNYFDALKDHLSLNNANIVVTGESGSSPISVVNYAKQQYDNAKSSGDAFDKVFCVFDKDTHDTYEKALQILASFKPNNTFIAITSVPCFEYWLLLHFIYTTKPFQGNGGKSCCDLLIEELKNYLPDYKKGDHSIFEKLSSNIAQAKAFATRSLNEANTNHSDNPSTNVHILVEYLENIKN